MSWVCLPSKLQLQTSSSVHREGLEGERAEVGGQPPTSQVYEGQKGRAVGAASPEEQEHRPLLEQEGSHFLRKDRLAWKHFWCLS